MFKQITGALLAGAVLASANVALSAEVCALPGPPPDQSLRPKKPVAPIEPSCIDRATRRSTCRPKVLDAFNASVDTYNAQLDKFNLDARVYIDALNRWQRTTEDYANCEVNLLNHGG